MPGWHLPGPGIEYRLLIAVGKLGLGDISCGVDSVNSLETVRSQHDRAHFQTFDDQQWFKPLHRIPSVSQVAGAPFP